MAEQELHYITDDLSETWLEEWAGAGVAEIEKMLGKRALFLDFYDARETQANLNSDVLLEDSSAAISSPTNE